MFRYKLHYEDGSEAGDAAYADNVNPAMSPCSAPQLREVLARPDRGRGGLALRGLLKVTVVVSSLAVDAKSPGRSVARRLARPACFPATCDQVAPWHEPPRPQHA